MAGLGFKISRGRVARSAACLKMLQGNFCLLEHRAALLRASRNKSSGIVFDFVAIDVLEARRERNLNLCFYAQPRAEHGGE